MTRNELMEYLMTYLFRDTPWLEVWLREPDEDGQERRHLFNVPTQELPDFIRTIRGFRGPVCLSICRPGGSEIEREMCW